MIPNSQLKTCIVPLDIKWGDIDANLQNAAYQLNQVEKDTDLVILPEVFATGYTEDISQIRSLAQPQDGRIIDTVKRWAQFFSMAIVGSFIASYPNGKFSNRAFMVEPSGEVTFYDKRHLFPLSNEAKVYTPGDKLPPVIRFRGWDIMLIVCYDLRFPVWCRNTPHTPYDILAVPANWPHSRIFQMHQLLSARAIENQAFAIGANRTGQDLYGTYPPGDSDIFDNMGSRIGETRRNGHIYAILSHHALEEARTRFPAWKSADSFTINP